MKKLFYVVFCMIAIGVASCSGNKAQGEVTEVAGDSTEVVDTVQADTLESAVADSTFTE